MASQPVPPLDSVRQAEADLLRNVMLARESAERALEETRVRAAHTLQQASAEGGQAGQARTKELIAKTEEEATSLVSEARLQAETAKIRGKMHMDALVGNIVHFVAGLKDDLRG